VVFRILSWKLLFEAVCSDSFNLFLLLDITILYISEVRVEGLETMDYLDNLKAKERFTEQGDAIVFESEVSNLLMLNIIIPNQYVTVMIFSMSRLIKFILPHPLKLPSLIMRRKEHLS
jgi:hypothetical protein